MCEWCQKSDDDSHFVLTETLIKFKAGVKLYMTFNSGRGCSCATIKKFFAALAINIIAK